jgi:nucleoside triphosphate pyrophosphatase
MPLELPLILASASPRRAELLTSAGYVFQVDAADVDESVSANEPPDIYALRVARAKAHAVAARHPRDCFILSADTVVVALRQSSGQAQTEILGKPADAADATQMLSRLSGDTHDVLTAVVVLGPRGEVSELVRTRVRFVELTPRDIAWYVATGEPEGKAGAYAIQGRAARFVDWIEGSWSNVVGLPVATVAKLLSAAGFPAAAASIRENPRGFAGN